MEELTQEDREKIQQQIVEYKQTAVSTNVQPSISVPITPDGKVANEDLDKAIQNQATPDKHEAHKIKNKIKGIWHKWRVTALDAKSLEIEKIACQISIERAKTQQELDRIRREEEFAEAEHWLALNKGNLEEIEANTTSKPSPFWYNIRRCCHHVTKITNNVPKLFRNLFWIGAVIIGLLLLKRFNVL